MSLQLSAKLVTEESWVAAKHTGTLRTEKSSNKGRARAGLSTPGPKPCSSWEEASAPGADAARHSKPMGFSSCLSVVSTLLM